MKYSFTPLGLKVRDFLIISDLHIGYKGMISYFQLDIMKRMLLEGREKYKYNNLILNGDLKDEFGKDLDDLRVFLKELKENFEELIIIKGNHDFYILNVAKYLEIPVFELFYLKPFYISHGDDYVDKKPLIIGNEHPSIKIELNHKLYNFKVFLKYKEELFVLPSFNPFSRDSNILELKKFISPNLNEINRDLLEIYAIIEDKVEYLGFLGELR